MLLVSTRLMRKSYNNFGANFSNKYLLIQIGNIDLCENMSFIFIEPKNISEVKDPKNLTMVSL